MQRGVDFRGHGDERRKGWVGGNAIASREGSAGVEVGEGVEQVRREVGGGCGDVEVWGTFAFEGSNGDPVDAAGGDGGEAVERAGDVDSEAVHGDPLAGTDADAGEFAVFDPDTGEVVAAGGWDTEGACAVDEGLFETAEVAMEVVAVGSEAEDGVADELAWAVPCGFAAAADFDERGGEGLGIAEAGAVLGAADGEYGVVLEEKDGFRGERVEEGAGGGFLEGEGVLIGDAAEPLDGRRRPWGGLELEIHLRYTGHRSGECKRVVGAAGGPVGRARGSSGFVGKEDSGGGRSGGLRDA